MRTVYIFDFFGTVISQLSTALITKASLNAKAVENNLRQPENLSRIFKKINRNQDGLVVMIAVNGNDSAAASKLLVEKCLERLTVADNKINYCTYIYDSTSYEVCLKQVIGDYFFQSGEIELTAKNIPSQNIVIVSAEHQLIDIAKKYNFEYVNSAADNTDYFELLNNKLNLDNCYYDQSNIDIVNKLTAERAKTLKGREAYAKLICKELAPLDVEEFLAACKLEMISRLHEMIKSLMTTKQYAVANANAAYKILFNECLTDCKENYAVKLASRDYVYLDSNFIKLDKAKCEELCAVFSDQINQAFDRYRQLQFYENEDLQALASNIAKTCEYQRRIWSDLIARKDILNEQMVDYLEHTKRKIQQLDSQKENVLGEDDLKNYVQVGSIEKIKRYIETNASLYSNKLEILQQPLNAQGDTALHIACLYGQFSLVKWLVEVQGVDVNLMNFDRYTPLHSACCGRDDETITFLLNLLTPEQMSIKANNSRSALHMAAHLRLNNIVKLMLEKNIEPNLIDRNNRTVLHYAAADNNVELVEWLLDTLEFNVRQRNVKGETACYEAFYHNHAQVIEAFTVRGIWLARDELDKLVLSAKKCNNDGIVLSLVSTLNEQLNSIEKMSGKPLNKTNQSYNVPAKNLSQSLTSILGAPIVHPLHSSASKEEPLFDVELTISAYDEPGLAPK